MADRPRTVLYSDDLLNRWQAMKDEIATLRAQLAEARAKLSKYDPAADIEYHPVVVNLRAQLADYRANLDTVCAHHDEHHARQEKLERIAQGLADELRETCRGCDNAADCPSHRKLLAAFDAYQQQKGQPS
jgi:predicted  nucleic acid-binding Zn-ribbon protein